MRVRLLVTRVGPGGGNDPGDVVDLPDAEAERLISSGQAVAVDVETASTAPGPQQAVKRGRGRPRKYPR